MIDVLRDVATREWARESNKAEGVRFVKQNEGKHQYKEICAKMVEFGPSMYGG